MIEFRDVHASYDGSAPILKGVSFTIRDGEFVAFVGTNGAGKSTTMRLMNGLLKPDAGQVLIDGVPTSDLRTSELARRVGFLFQNPDSQICCNTARQLLALASIVVLAPPVVVLDEPTTGLDYRECVKVMDIIRRIHERGTTVVMVCHDMEVVADYAARCIVMSGGEVVDDAPTFDVLRNRETLERASLVPPQIVELSLELGREMPHLADGPVGRANTLDEMAAAVMEEVRTSERSVCA